jgi:hypothetical protein
MNFRNLIAESSFPQGFAEFPCVGKLGMNWGWEERLAQRGCGWNRERASTCPSLQAGRVARELHLDWRTVKASKSGNIGSTGDRHQRRAYGLRDEQYCALRSLPACFRRSKNGPKPSTRFAEDPRNKAEIDFGNIRDKHLLD